MVFNMKKAAGKVLPILAFWLFLLPLFFSCSNSSEKRSFNSSLDRIDSLINQKLYKEACQELSKIEKQAFGAWAELGIFRRYRQCDENLKAEKFLANAIKKNPENIELRAVFTDFLLRSERIDEALTYGKKLSGTKYGSIYSEAVFSDVNRKDQSGLKHTVYKNPDYYPVYYDAWTGSQDNSWLRNCAILNLMKGAYESSFEIVPETVYDSRDAYFWALVCFDARRFGDAVNYLESSKKLLKNRINRFQKMDEEVRVSLLESDALSSLGDEEGAEKIRQSFISSLEENEEGWVLLNDSLISSKNVENKREVSQAEEKAAYLFTNSARWAFDNKNDQAGKKLITFAVNKWPDFVPALSLYADFAWKSGLEMEKDFLELSLSDKGLQTLEMEKYDSRVIIPVNDAIFRIDESLERTKDPLLYIIRLDLRYKMEKKLSDKEKTADLWHILEENAIAPSVYPELMTDYALSFLLNHKETESAWTLYSRYVSSKYKIPLDSLFFENLIKKVHEVDFPSLEYGAYFAALQNRADDALVLHELLVFEENEYSASKFVKASASDQACVNLANIYDSLSRRKEALDLYGKAFGRTASSAKKAEVMQRMAEIYFETADYKNARHSAEYALSLDKNMVSSRLLLSRLKEIK